MAAGHTHLDGGISGGSGCWDCVAGHEGSSKRPIHSFRTVFSARGPDRGGMGNGIMALVFSWFVISTQRIL